MTFPLCTTSHGEGRRFDRLQRILAQPYEARDLADFERARVASFLEREVWPRVPADQLGRAPDRAERERILGYGEAGV
jgi:hypothetical protein